jgi:hypothetical protein
MSMRVRKRNFGVGVGSVGAAVAVVAFGGCGSFDAANGSLATDAGASGGDGAVDTGRGGEDGPDDARPRMGARCDVRKPFTSSLPLREPSGQGLGAPASAYAPTLTADESLLFIEVPRIDGGTQIVSSARSGNAFAPPAPYPIVPSVDRDVEPSLRLDGTRMVFLSDREAPGKLSPLQMFSVTRASDGGFDVPRRLVVGFDAAASNQATPFLSADKTELYFSSTLAGTLDIYRARVTSGDDFGLATRVDALSSPGGEDDSPVLSADGLSVYFASDRLAAGPAIKSIFVAHRLATSLEFDLPTLVDELHDATIGRRPGWLSPDSCRLYFAAPDGTGRVAIFVASRQP